MRPTVYLHTIDPATEVGRRGTVGPSIATAALLTSTSRRPEVKAASAMVRATLARIGSVELMRGNQPAVVGQVPGGSLCYVLGACVDDDVQPMGRPVAARCRVPAPGSPL
jgi:hypothetical protein